LVELIFFDFEVFKYDWLVVAIDPALQKEFVIVNDKPQLEKLYNEYKKDIWIGYNCRGYDQYILKGIILGFDPKRINDWIIVKGRKGWEFSSMFNKLPLNLYDVMPNIPVSLKVLEGFMGNNIHETSVPFDLDRKLTEQEIGETIKYCRFDVHQTIEVFMRRKNEFDSQMQLVKTFNLPLSYLGKTQAQLAAIILGAKKKKLNDEWEIRLPHTARLGKYKEVGNWFLNPDNHNYDCKLDIDICGLTHTIAWGGVHAGKKKYNYKCKADEVILDIDVDQLYPTLMIVYNLLSRAVEEPERFKNILDTSLRLKREGKKKEREPYKRICNITYGAEGDKFNPMYDPLHRNLVCVYGQVLIIDLLDKIEDLVELLQSNTDGIFVKLKRSKVPELKRRIADWEQRTGLKMSYDEFNAMYAKDVNNYVAVRPDGSYHSKGAYVKELNDLDYDLPIVNEAVKNYILYGTPVEVTVFGCNDFRKFQKIVKLSNKYKWVEHEGKRGNTKFDNKCYRVFASKAEGDGRILKCDGVRNPAKFGNTPDRCFICNDDIGGQTADRFPKLDRQWYIDLSNKRLSDFGVLV
jgi:DNA polymerase